MAGMALRAEAIEASSEEDIGGLGSLLAVLVRNVLLMRPNVPKRSV
jgi:hypothetical protein